MALRGAVIGCGFFANNHLHAWMDLDDAEIVAVCDRDRDKAESAARRFGVARSYDDAEAMLSLEGLDFVDIVTTVESHRGLVEAAARHRVPAICQKPFATNLVDAEAMVTACQDAGVALMVHENFRWQRPLLEVGHVLSGGAIGKPFFGRISFRHDYDVYRNQPYLAEIEQFAILDVGIHVLDVARFYLGEVKRLSCTTCRANPAIQGEDVVTMLLEHVGGATSVVDCSFFSHVEPNPFPQTMVEVDGVSGSIRLSQDYRLQVTSGGRTTVSDVDAAPAAWMERPWHVVQDSVRSIQAHWLSCLRQGREPATSGRDNLRTLTLGLAAYEAAAGGKTISFEAW